MIITSMGSFVRSWSFDMGQKCGCNVYLWQVGRCRLVVLLIMWRCSGCKGESGFLALGVLQGSHRLECFSSVQLFRIMQLRYLMTNLLKRTFINNLPVQMGNWVCGQCLGFPPVTTTSRCICMGKAKMGQRFDMR